MAKISMHITVETEERSDRWACRSPEFGFTVYGETRQAARLEVNKALTALLGSFHGDMEAIGRFLQKRQVRYYSNPGDGQNTTCQTGFAALPPQEDIAAYREGRATEVSLEEVLIAT